MERAQRRAQERARGRPRRFTDVIPFDDAWEIRAEISTRLRLSEEGRGRYEGREARGCCSVGRKGAMVSFVRIGSIPALAGEYVQQQTGGLT